MCRLPRNILKLYVKKSFFATLYAHIMTQKSIDLCDVVPSHTKKICPAMYKPLFRPHTACVG